MISDNPQSSASYTCMHSTVMRYASCDTRHVLPVIGAHNTGERDISQGAIDSSTSRLVQIHDACLEALISA